MTFDEVLKIEKIKIRVSKFKEKNLNKQLIERTQFLDDSANISERLYCLDNNIKTKHKCKICDNYTNYLKYSKGYCLYCSTKCLSDDKDIKIKKRITCVKKYGVDSFTKTEEYLKKTKETNFKKYGVDYYFQCSDKQEKTKITNLKKYGNEHHMKSEEFIIKFKENNIKLFGVDNVSKLEKIKDKKRKTFEKNYNLNHTSDELKNNFNKYKNEVWRITSRLRKKLLNKWTGYDYYDNEYIKENYKLNYNDNNYPTIDHKISIYYGFSNNIEPYIISNTDNLCITKKEINRKKSIRNENEFKKDIENF